MPQCSQRNISMCMDLYELTMANGYYADRDCSEQVVFDVFYRKNPDKGGFAVFAGLEQVVEYIENLHFDEEEIEYLRSLGLYSEAFLTYLKNYRFTGSVDAVPEGTIVYPHEPLLTITAPLIDAQLVETAILTEINHQSLIATKARRIVRAAKGRSVSDFGARRAHNVDAAVYGARAAYIGGAANTATVLAGKMFNIPVSGTMAHSWVMYYDSEYEAFAQFCRIYPDNAVLLVDTYDVVRSGVPNAIQAAKEVLDSLGIDILIAGLVKDDKHRTSRLLDKNGEVIEIEKDSPLFFFLTTLQDEVHRYAITYHRKLRSKAMNKSILDDIEGVGEVRKKQIWKKYKTIKNLRNATLEELKEFLPANVAENVLELVGQKTLDNH